MVQDEIRALEEQLTIPAVRASADALDALLSEEFVEFGSSGRIYTKQEVIAQLLAKPNDQVMLGDLQVRPLSDDVALATYRTNASRRSSVWRREGERWRVVFHQGTPIATNE